MRTNSIFVKVKYVSHKRDQLIENNYEMCEDTNSKKLTR